MSASSSIEQELSSFAKMAKEAGNRGQPSVYSAASQLPAPLQVRIGFIRSYQANQTEEAKLKGETAIRTLTTMRPFFQHGPAPPISSLQHTTIRKVAEKVNHVHDDSILFLKTIYACYRIVGTSILVQDSAGDCLMMTLYNIVPPNEDPNDMFPEGTYLALLAPYMKNSQDNPAQNVFLRCDNPECIRIFSSKRSWSAAKRGKKLVDVDGLDPKQLRQDGTLAFQQERYEAAARCYARALDCPNIQQDNKVVCLSNLSETRLRQKRWEAAVDHAKLALAIDSSHTKSRYRLASALVHLNKFVEASSCIASEKGRVFRELQKDLKRLAKEQQGEYNLKDIRKEAACYPGQALKTFHADFTSSLIQQGVEIQMHEDFSYRGSVAREGIKAHTIISSSKALVFCQAKRDQMLGCFNPYTKLNQNDSSVELENELVLMMYHRPATKSKVYSLASGLESPEAAQNEKIDIKRITGIVTSNVFGTSEMEDLEMTFDTVKRNMKNPHQMPTPEEQALAKAKQGSGFWIGESLFNHSCVPNCTWKQIGDQMFVLTTKEVAPGEELTISYVDLLLSFEERDTIFKDWIQPGMGFSCQCDWCRLMRSSIELQKCQKQAHDAYRAAANMVSSQPIKMAVAGEQAISTRERQSIFDAFSDIPLKLQHIAVAHLWVVEGSVQAHNDNFESAMAAYQKAADIKYAVRGGVGIDRAKDLWRVVGISLACQNQAKAMELLTAIYKDMFQPSAMRNTDDAFRTLTLHYAMPWWQDAYDASRVQHMEMLLARVLRSKF